MTIEAQLWDGTILEFPDDTKPEVIQATAKRLTLERQGKAPAAKPEPAKTASFDEGGIAPHAKFNELIADERYLSLSPQDQYNVRRSFFHKVAADPRFRELSSEDQMNIGKRILFKGTEGEPATFFEGVKRSLYSGVQAVGKMAVGAYKSLDPTQAESMLEAGAAPVIAGIAATPTAVGGEFAGEVVRKTAEQLGASPTTQAVLGTAADFAVPGSFVPKAVRGVRARAEGPKVAPKAAEVQPAAAAAKPALSPELRARAEAIEQQLLEAERLRRSPAGHDLLRRELAAEEARGHAAEEAAVPQRARDIEAAITEAERMRQSPAGRELLHRQFAEQEAKAAQPDAKPAAEVKPLSVEERIAQLEAENAQLREKGKQVKEKPTAVDELMRLEDENTKLWQGVFESGGKRKDDAIKANDAKIKAIEKRITPKNIGVIEFFDPDRNAGAIVHASTKTPDAYQVSFFDQRGFMSDIQTKDIGEALRNARTGGGVRSSGNLERMAATQEFQRGNELTRVVGLGNELRAKGDYEGARNIEDTYQRGGWDEAKAAFEQRIKTKVPDAETKPPQVETPAAKAEPMAAVPETAEHFEKTFKTVWDEHITELKAVERGDKPAFYSATPDKEASAYAKKNPRLQIHENVTDSGDFIVVPKTPAGEFAADRLKELSAMRKDVFRHRDEIELEEWNRRFSKILGYDEELAGSIHGTLGYGPRDLEARRIFGYKQREAAATKPKVATQRLEDHEVAVSTFIRTGAEARNVPPGLMRAKVQQAEGPLPLETAHANTVEQMSIVELLKNGMSETGAVGKLTPEQAAAEVEARAARKELWSRLFGLGRERGISLEEAARETGVPEKQLKKLRKEAELEKWSPTEKERPFSPLEKEMGKMAGEPRIFEPIPDPFKGSRLNTPTTKEVTDAAYEAYIASGKQIDPDIPITIQVARDLAEGKLDLSRLEEALEGKGLNLKDLGEGLLATESNAGRQLQQMSALKQKLKAAGVEIGDYGKEPPPSGWEYASDLFRRWINIWKGSLVGQLATATRNVETQTARVGIDAIEKMTDGVIQRMFRLGPGAEKGLSSGFHRAIEDLVDLAKSGKRQQANEILTLFPNQRSRIFYQFASDVNDAVGGRSIPPGKIAGAFERITQSAEKVVYWANIINRGQEFLVRRAAFRAKLAELLERSGQNIDAIDPRAIDENMVAQAVDHALEMTFAVTPTKGVGKWIMDLYNQVPVLSFIAPFPKFMWNSWKNIMEFQPTALFKLLSKKERAAIAAGDTKTISRALIGSGLLTSAYMLRNSEYAGEKWYELQVDDKTIDTRPYNPFASYLFIADVAKRINDGTLDKLGFKEIAQGLFSANFRAGAGLFMLDQVGDFVGGIVAGEGWEKAWENIQRSTGEVAAGFFTPIQTIRDVLSDERLLSFIGAEDFAAEESKMRDVRGQPFLGPIKSKIPGLSQTLPQTQFPIGPGSQREEPGLRQVTGIAMRTKTFAQKEADRLGLEQRDILAYSGIPELDRATAELMRPAAERTLTTLMSSRAYMQANDLQKRIWFKKWAHDIGNRARKQVLARNPDLRLEYMIKRAGKDRGKQLREMYAARGLIAND